jgi:predicted nuclease with TOPRIM domain
MEKIIVELKKKIESYNLPEGLEVIPSYASIKSSKEELYKKYSNTVMTYNRVCDTLSKLQFSSITVDRLLKELPNSNEVYSRQKLFSTELKSLKDEIKGMIESYKYLKDGLEATVRFYSSVQYILTSYRMEDC